MDQHFRHLLPSKDRHSRIEAEGIRRDRSPSSYAGRSKDDRQRSSSPKGSHVLEKSKYVSERRRSASPSKSEQFPGRREHQSKDIRGKVSREEGRHPGEQYSPNMSRNREAKLDRFSSFINAPDVVS